MEPKKYPLRHLNSRRGLYFIIVLVVLLTILYFALEWKTPYDDGGYDLNDDRVVPKDTTDSSFILNME